MKSPCTVHVCTLHIHSEDGEYNATRNDGRTSKHDAAKLQKLKITHRYVGVLISPYPDLLPDVVGRNRQCRWKEKSVHVPNCKFFLLRVLVVPRTEAEMKHVRRRARFQQHRDASCHQVFSSPARQGAEVNSRHSARNVKGTCTIICHRQKLGGPV